MMTLTGQSHLVKIVLIKNNKCSHSDIAHNTGKNLRFI